MCRIDSRLARKADTWYSGCTKKVMFQKHTGTAILLRWLKPITVHEGAMSIIHYRTLRANPPFLESFICHVINTYDTIDPSSGEFWVGDGQRDRRIQQQSASIVAPRQVPLAAGRVATLHCNKVCVLLWFTAAEPVQQGTLQPKQHSLTSESSLEFGVSAC